MRRRYVPGGIDIADTTGDIARSCSSADHCAAMRPFASYSANAAAESFVPAGDCIGQTFA
jgi:hypothetical protein